MDNLPEVKASTPMPAVKKPKPPMDDRCGHHIILKTMISKQTPMKVELMNGHKVFGTISQFDNYTITIRDEDENGMPRTIYKHAILSFMPA